MTEKTEQAESSPQEGAQESVTPESQTADKVEETSVKEDSQPPKDEQSESSTEAETAVDAIKKALTEDEEDEQIPDQPEEVEAPVAKDAPKDAVEEETDDIYAEPEGLKPKAQERFRSLVEDNKYKADQLEQAQTALTEIQKTVQQSNMTPEEFGYLIDYGRMAVSKDPKELEYALQTAQNEVLRISQALGKEVDGVDLLTGHPELQKRVEDYELTREDALRIAKAERELEQYKKVQTQQTQQADEANKRQTAQDQSLAKVKSFMDKMKATDIDYSAKEAKLVEQAAKVRENYPPEQWPVVIQDLYETMGFGASDKKQELKTSAPAPIQSTTSTVGSQVPKTMQEAIHLGLGDA